MSKALLAGLAATLLSAGTPPAAPPATADDHPVIELRQYKIKAGQRDAMIALFEREFVDSQEALGAHVVGRFRDMDDPNRFTWIRGFDNMATRQSALNAFYYGPVWQAHRGEANAMLDDNDNVLLLRPAWDDSGFERRAGAPRPAQTTAGDDDIVIATIYYLWKEPAEGFSSFFRQTVGPRLESAGLPVLGAYIPEEQANNFPPLPVRQGERIFVWFSRATDRDQFTRALGRLDQDSDWKNLVAPGLTDAQERPAQILYLRPTPNARMR